MRVEFAASTLDDADDCWITFAFDCASKDDPESYEFGRADGRNIEFSETAMVVLLARFKNHKITIASFDPFKAVVPVLSIKVTEN